MLLIRIRTFDLSFTLGSQILKLPKSRGLTFNLQFGKMLRASNEAVVVLAYRDCPAVCAFRAVAAYISAAQRMGWDLTTGHPFPVITAQGGRSSLPLSATRIMTAFQGHLRAAELPSHFTMHSFRVGGSLSKMAIQLEYPHLIQITEPQIVSECLRFCIAERSLLFFAPETS